MIDSANKIANYFANDSDPDICHVGSALYLGPQIRMMLSEYTPFGDAARGIPPAVRDNVLVSKSAWLGLYQEATLRNFETLQAAVASKVGNGWYGNILDVASNFRQEFESWKMVF